MKLENERKRRAHKSSMHAEKKTDCLNRGQNSDRKYQLNQLRSDRWSVIPIRWKRVDVTGNTYGFESPFYSLRSVGKQLITVRSNTRQYRESGLLDTLNVTPSRFGWCDFPSLIYIGDDFTHSSKTNSTKNLQDYLIVTI